MSRSPHSKGSPESWRAPSNSLEVQCRSPQEGSKPYGRQRVPGRRGTLGPHLRTNVCESLSRGPSACRPANIMGHRAQRHHPASWRTDIGRAREHGRRASLAGCSTSSCQRRKAAGGCHSHRCDAGHTPVARDGPRSWRQRAALVVIGSATVCESTARYDGQHRIRTGCVEARASRRYRSRPRRSCRRRGSAGLARMYLRSSGTLRKSPKSPLMNASGAVVQLALVEPQRAEMGNLPSICRCRARVDSGGTALEAVFHWAPESGAAPPASS